MEFTKKQLDLLNKYNLKQEDIKEINTSYLEVWDGKSKHKESVPMKHFMCWCGTYELLWMIGHLQGKCKSCFNTNK